MKQDMNDSFRITLRAMVVAAMTLLAGGNAAAQDSGEGSGGTTTPTTSGVVVHGNVYGGGNKEDVGGSVTVNIKAGTVDKDVYGGGALANTNINNTTDPSANTTTVNLLGGTIKGDAYGGGLGQFGTEIIGEKYTQEEIDAAQEGDDAYGKTTDDWKVEPVAASEGVGAVKAMVYGDVYVTLGSETGTSATAFYIDHYTGDHAGVVKSGRVFGCNNLNGSPLGNVTVTVWKTVEGNTPRSATADKSNADATYELAAVYGGGNLANYTVTGKKTHVIINGCAIPSIEYVYGGGNAAAVPQASVDVNGTYEIGYVFGGGNGADEYTLDDGTSWNTNPGANVNGNATTMLYAGTIHEAFGGSNEKGTISGTVFIDTQSAVNSAAEGYCALNLGKLYGAGKNADIEGDLIMTLGCMPGDENPTTEVYGGAENANVKGNVELTITSGSFGKVFGGNNTSGAIFGHIKLNIEETGCCPIKIDELYLGGYNAPYSVYGYYEDGTIEGTEKPKYVAIQSASDTHTAVCFGDGSSSDHTKAPYADPELNVISCTYIGKVFGGGLGVPATMYANPTVNINMIQGAFANSISSTTDNPNQLGEIGTVYGGGNAADVVGDPTVNIGTAATVDLVSTSTTGNTVKGAYITGNVFGGGMGKDDTFTCEKAMVGKEGDGINNPDGGTTVNIGNGIVMGNVYGGGEIGRVEKNTVVTIGLTSGTGTPIIKGDVFGGGKGLETHGYAALVRGNPTVTIQGNAKVLHSVYGGGEIASVARYQVVGGVPVALAGEEGNYSGYCTVNVLGNAIIGPDEKMVMHHVDAQGNTVNGSDGFPLLPDDAGHVFAAGKGVLPKIYTYGDNDNRPKRMMAYDDSKFNSSNSDYWAYSDDSHQNVWQYFKDESEYFEFIQTLALATQTEVTISGNAFVKGSVYGGSENGLVQYDTHVTIEGGQIGCGKNTTDRHPDEVWGDTYTVPENTDLECASWEYDPSSGAPYDPNAKYLYDGKYYYDEAHTKYAEGGSIVAKDGHTYYGNVFGGGSGSVPYYDTQQGISRYIPTAGEVKGNTYVTISGGHILTNVYGGCETTNVLGTANVTMTGGTIGVPRTDDQIVAHPVTGYLFGAGKGDQRIFFNKETNVNDAVVTVERGRIYGSVYGGGEDGHVLRNVTMTIGKTGTTTGPTIGMKGTSYYDGHVFGGGRGFGGEALTAGNVGGAVDVNIESGNILGSVYGGGRLASVGYGLYLTTEEGYGIMRADDEYDGSYTNPSTDPAGTFFNKGRGKITVTVNGGTIGNDETDDKYGGNVFGGSMGRLTKQDGSAFDRADHWSLLATAKKTTVNVSDGTIKRSVYGGGEMGTVTTDAIVNVSGGTIGTSGKGGAEFGNVYGGGKGYVDPAGSNYITAGIIKGDTKVTVSGTSQILHNIYGGGAYGSVGEFDYDTTTGMPTGRKEDTTGGTANVTITGGTIGTNGKENGMVFGSSRGDVGAPGEIHDKLAWVYDANVVIGTSGSDDGPQIKGSVYGSGENGHTYNNAEVTLHSGTIGIANSSDSGYSVESGGTTYTGAAYPYRGNLYGGGCGTDKYYSSAVPEGHTATDGNGDKYNPLAGIVYGTTTVTIDGGQVVRNVYGAGAMGSVGKMTKGATTNAVSFTDGGATTIAISGGTIGVNGTAGVGNVFGAARGDETTQTDVALVKTTDVTISGNATVWGNVYGGGQIGCVGTFTERAADGKYIWTSDAQNLNGLTKVSITGGETKGHVFGAGKGEANTFKCEKAMVRETIVSVSNGEVGGNVYGGGEIGRVEENTEVKIGVGDGTCSPTISGSVFGAGAGLETHGYSALVRGNTRVTVDGSATIGQSVYGGGEIASVGRYGLDEHKMPEILLDGGYCYVTVQGSATIGSTTVEGNVFGACKGVVPHLDDKDDTDKTKRPRRMTVYTNETDFPETDKDNTWEYYDESVTPKLVWEYFQTEETYDTYLQTLALATHPEVTINGSATVNGSVYGGGEMGLTKGSVMVNILGGTITEDVYGGGALANTNTTSAVGVLDNAGIPQKTNEQYQTTTVDPKTTVNLLGGSMRDAYGGGLGQLAVASQGTEGQPGYQAAVPAIEAKVFGDVKVNLNGLQAATDINTSILNSLTTGSKLDAVGSGYIVKSSAKGAVVSRVFGCNNLNGTPTKKVQVYVFGTQKSDETQLNAKAERNTGSYDVQAVYGGGNLSPYVPADALLAYTDENKAKVDAARPEVYIDGCDLTSIKQVYGGGNAAPVPATFVEIRRCYEIDEVFGGGNGFDNYSVEERGNTVWYQNPGANVGYYTGYFTNYATYSNYETRTSGGGSGTDSNPYLAVVNPNYDGDEIIVVDGVEKNMKETRLAAADIQYGSGIARLEVKGGTIQTSYGGSNSKGNVRAKLSSVYSAMFDDCEMQVAQSYGGGKKAYSDGESDMVADCAKGVKDMFGGAKDADMNGDINMLITNGSSLERVFGGNNTSGAVNGSITITLKEGGCEPIRIDELYAGGFLAPYSVYGYKKTNGVYDTEEVEYIDTDGTTKTRTQRIPLESGTRLYNDPRINVISATYIGNIFGGGYQAKLVGNPHINVNMTTGFVKVTKTLVEGTTDQYIYKDVAGNTYAADKVREESLDPSNPEVKTLIATTDIGTIGNIYGGGNMADIVGDTYVEIGTGTEHNDAGELVAITPARNGAKITDNVFGGGKGKADSFTCEKAMVTGANGTNVIIGNGTIGGTVYGGGEIGRVENNTVVTIGLEEGTGAPVIEGNVFGAGKGANTHGYAALVRGNTTVTVQGNAKIGKSVYGGGEIASVGKYNIADAAYHAAHPEVEVGMPYSLVSDNRGICTVVVQGNAEIGPDGMKMLNTETGKPDDTGHVFGAGKGVLPYELLGTDGPKRMAPGTTESPTGVWEYYNETQYQGEGNYIDAYLRYIETLALATQTDVTISGNAFVKGSVYGGSENGHVQHNTHVTIADKCQIGNGEGVNRRYTSEEWASESLAECAHWDFDASSGAPYDPLAQTDGTYDYTNYTFVPEAEREANAKGGMPVAKDGHTFYGNVFGGGSGLIPYAPGKWHRAAGSVGGNTQVDITGGHILTSVYGGNEQTDVGTYTKDANGALVVPVEGTGKCIINMSGGTIGVPRTVDQMKAHPVTCYLFGAGKGDQRIFFNTWTNVIETEVNISGTARIYGSTFGGGEDGHVIGKAVTNIGGTVTIDNADISHSNVIIGTTGTSYVDGNVFGGGRGFSGEAQTAGTIGGNVTVNIYNGTMLGSVYGGGRLASVGTLFTQPEDDNYGNFVEDEDGGGKTYGHVDINISGGTIGNLNIGYEDDGVEGAEHSGNVFGGSMGRLNLLNGNINPIWPKMAQVKETKINISGNAVIKRNVYGGGELGTVRDNTHVTISGGQVNRDVYGGGYGSEDDDLHTIFNVKEPNSTNTGFIDNTYAFTPMQFAGCVGKSTTVDVSGGYIRKSVYGGGEMASVGIMNCLVEEVTSEPGKDKIVVAKDNGKWTIYKNMRKHWDVDKEFALSWPIEFSYVPTFDGATHINITGGRIGTTTDDDYGTDNGDVYGGGKGFAGDYNDYVFCANVGSTDVNINYASGATTLDPAAYMSGGDCIAGAVYGGGENGHVMGDTHVTLTNGLIGHGLYGGGSGKGTFSQKLLKIGKTAGSTNNDDYYTRDIYSITAGKVFGNTTVDMSGGYVVRNVYGGGTMGSVGKGNYAGGTDDYSTTGYGENAGGNLWTSSAEGDNAWQFLNSGICTVNITGGTVGYTGTKDGLPYGNVFGGCRGEAAPNIVETPRYLYSPEFFVGYANETRVTIGAKGSTTGPRIFGSVYGGGQDGHVRGDAKVTIYSGEIGSTYAGNDLNALEWKYAGNVFGAGSGIGKYQYDFDYDGKYESTVKYNNGRAEVDTKEEDYSTSAGSVTRFTKVEVKGGTIHRNVYGGGSLASVGAPKIGQSYDPYHPDDAEHSSEAGKQSLNKVAISGGTIGDATSVAAGYGGDVNGGSRGELTFENSLANPSSFANSVYTDVTISDNANVLGNVFGGGEAGPIKHDTKVKMVGGTVGNDLYGGGDLADVGGNTKVTLTGGTITHDAYGGARGKAAEGNDPGVAANVGGDVLVDVNNVANGAKGCVVERVFGANNVNGTPKGHVKVHVHATQNKNTGNVSAKADSGYDVAYVFGGGNASDYVPTDATQSTEVIIEGCDLTSIQEVYGGGYGAATPGTNVLIKGTKIIDNVFGGGYGAGTDNPGANVGYVTGGSQYELGTGKAVVQLMAGTVNNVYGGSNTKGDIRGGSNVTNVANDNSPGCCEKLSVQEIYGGGSQADMFGGTEIVLGCMPNDWIGAIYAGAENANVGNDVSLTLTSGKFGRVFGGNKSGGTIDGYIEVNIEENPDCSTPIIIGGLYGGGNEALYTTPARYGKDYLSPRVNVRAFTSIGNIYGGGFGASATVTGNPLVNINVVEGGRKYDGELKDLEDGTTVTLHARKADAKMGVIGNVFGGGNAAKVIGNTNVHIGTEAKQKMLSLQTKDADGTVHEVEKDVLGADIRGNVYGAGNNAEVTGDTNVVIGQKAE